MSENYDCKRCGARMGIAGGGEEWTADDYAAQEFFDSEVDYHESGACIPAKAAPKRKLLTRRQLIEGARRRLTALRPKRVAPGDLSPAQQRWAAIKAMPTRRSVRLPVRPAPKPAVVSARALRARRDSTRSSRARRDRAAALTSKSA